MPTGPKGERRPADVIGNAVKVMRIVTGEEPEDYGGESPKGRSAVELGSKDGKKRAAGMRAEQRSKITFDAAKAKRPAHAEEE